MEEIKHLKIGFGVLNFGISEQLKEQNFKFNLEEVKRFQKLRESINYLVFADLISRSEREKIIQKLFLKIKEHIIKENPTQ